MIVQNVIHRLIYTTEDWNLKCGAAFLFTSFVYLVTFQRHECSRIYQSLRNFVNVSKCVFYICVVYQICLLTALFQTTDRIRESLRLFDGSLGVSLPERFYGGNCRLYDWDQTNNPWHNIIDKIDCFVVVHFFGYLLPMLIIRDSRVLWMISIGFELIEYSLEHQLANFNECWWDHWILDVCVCNGLGILVGGILLRLMQYDTQRWTNTNAYEQSNRNDNRNSTGCFMWRWFAILSLVTVILLIQLNSFYLKYIFWVPPSHFLNPVRLTMLWGIGSIAIDEFYKYTHSTDQIVHFGSNCKLMCSILVSEMLLIIKCDYELISQSPPSYVLIGWAILFSSFIGWILYSNRSELWRRISIYELYVKIKWI